MKDWSFLFEPLQDIEGFRQTVKVIEDKKGPVAVSGLAEAQKAHFSTGLLWFEQGDTPGGQRKKGLFVAPGEMQAKRLFDDFANFFGEGAVFFPSREVMLRHVDAQNYYGEQKRLEALTKISEGEYEFIVTSIDAIALKTCSREVFADKGITFAVGKVFERENLLHDLVEMGYVREEAVDGCGQFAVRGGIVDIFPSNSDCPVRIEFFDDEVDSLRLFDVETQRSLEQQDSITIYPCRETETAYGMPEASLLDYIDEETVLFVDEYARSKQRLENLLMEYQTQRERYLEDAEETEDETEDERLNEYNHYFDYDELLGRLMSKNTVLTMALMGESNIEGARALYEIETRQLSAYRGGNVLLNELRAWKEKNSRVVILTAGKSRGERLSAYFAEENMLVPYVEEPSGLAAGSIIVTKGNLNKGFEYPEAGLVVISSGEAVSAEEAEKARRRRERRRQKEEGSRINTFTELKIGDYVVHNIHGIGKFVGIEQVKVEGITRDYIKIMYLDNGFVYIPTNQTDLIQKYIGSEGRTPRLNKLGGSEWHRAKRRVKESLMDLAEELVKLYAARRAAKGFVYSKDTVWQRQFEDDFPYEETPDQLRAIEDIKNDMESERPMERLLCGDVGFGKTEVAIRAIFKAVMDGRQAIYLCPTTVLAQQQYELFTERLRDYPINVGLLSRFCSRGQVNETINQLRRGEVDIVVGTHRVLSKDVSFKNLGLLVIDEEQRFGVKHKEAIKEMRTNIDVLTMTATPIPRTLHMSLNGIRDISLLETPPEDRYPVQTFVAEYDESFIRDAVEREVARGGQVFYLYNRVRTLHVALARLQELMPEVRFGVAHGQMREGELEEVIHNFINGMYDVLLCTTIIESGIDMPNVNTLIVENAERMGLAQLYQIRGRVGRSNKMAYAYITYQKNKVLTEEAEKRLKSIKEFTEFGAGFKVAMRDLEIRGAGNLLGPEQHGQMDTVGYGMYCRLLDEAVHELKEIAKYAGDVEGESVEVAQNKTETAQQEEKKRLTREKMKELTEKRIKEWLEEEESDDTEMNIDIKVSAYISSAFIRSDKLRVEFYRKIAEIEDEDDASDLRDELLDRFGDLPAETDALIEMGMIKNLAAKCKLCEIVQQTPIGRQKATPVNMKAGGSRDEIVFKYKNAGDFQVEKMGELIATYGSALRLLATGTPAFVLTIQNGNNIINEVKTFLKMLCEPVEQNG